MLSNNVLTPGGNMIKYSEIVNNFRNNPRDICTKPMNRRTGKWFYVYVEDGKVFVDSAKTNNPKSTISKPRVLLEKELGDIFELYLKRKKGQSVYAEASEITRNQVYWYGIFNDMEL